MVRTLAVFATVALLGASVSSTLADDYGNPAPAPAAPAAPLPAPPPPPIPPSASGGANAAAGANMGVPAANAPVSGGYYLDGVYYAPGTGPIANAAQAPVGTTYVSPPPVYYSSSYCCRCCGGLFGHGGFLGAGLFR